MIARNDGKKSWAKYDWARWFRSPKFCLVHGRDYSVSQSAMAQQIRAAAGRFRCGVSITDRGDRLLVTVFHRDLGEAAPRGRRPTVDPRPGRDATATRPAGNPETQHGG